MLALIAHTLAFSLMYQDVFKADQPKPYRPHQSLTTIGSGGADDGWQRWTAQRSVESMRSSLLGKRRSMCLPRYFCCGQALKVGAMCAAAFTVGVTTTLVWNSMTWVSCLRRGEIPTTAPLFRHYAHTVSRAINGHIPSGNTQIFIKQALMKHVINIVWNFGGLLASLIALPAFRSYKNSVNTFLLPWISWTIANITVTSVNAFCEMLQRSFISTDISSTLSYISLPVSIYCLANVISYYLFLGEARSSRIPKNYYPVRRRATTGGLSASAHQTTSTTDSSAEIQRYQGYHLSDLCFDRSAAEQSEQSDRRSKNRSDSASSAVSRYWKLSAQSGTRLIPRTSVAGRSSTASVIIELQPPRHDPDDEQL